MEAGYTTITNEEFLEYNKLKNELKEFVDSNEVYLFNGNSRSFYDITIITKDDAIHMIKANYEVKLDKRNSYIKDLQYDINKLKEENRALRFKLESKNWFQRLFNL